MINNNNNNNLNNNNNNNNLNNNNNNLNNNNVNIGNPGVPGALPIPAVPIIPKISLLDMKCEISNNNNQHNPVNYISLIDYIKNYIKNRLKYNGKFCIITNDAILKHDDLLNENNLLNFIKNKFSNDFYISFGKRYQSSLFIPELNLNNMSNDLFIIWDKNIINEINETILFFKSQLEILLNNSDNFRPHYNLPISSNYVSVIPIVIYNILNFDIFKGNNLQLYIKNYNKKFTQST